MDRPICVMKFGGSSVGSVERILRVADIIYRKSKDYRPIIVVSAMGNTTDRLLGMAYSITKDPPPREIDMLLTAGERISMALLSMALHEKGLEALSFTGSQVGIITENRFNKARVLEVKLLRVKEALNEGKIPVIAGFQGVSTKKEITTLGRGGSDLTAVALAISLGGVRCEIYTDVDGVYSLDPKKYPFARKYDRISFEVLSELSFAGAKVMHSRAVNLAAKYDLPFYILSSFHPEKGGTVVERYLESPGVKGIAYKNVVMFDVEGADDRFILEDILQEIEIINYSHDSTGKHLIFTIEEGDKSAMIKILSNSNVRYTIREELVMISIVGWGIGSSPEIRDQVSDVLRNEHVYNISISDMRISFVVDAPKKDELVRKLSERFNLLV